MYFPILRGRQNELIAVRELAQAGKLSHVIPVIEPVKTSSTLLSTIEAMAEQGSDLMVVANPQVGTFGNDLKNDPAFAERYYGALEGSAGVVFAYRTGQGVDVVQGDVRGEKVAYFLERDSKSEYEGLCRARTPDFTFTNAEFPRMKRRAEGRLITLDERYRPQDRNADYRDHDDDPLSEENVYYGEENCYGFADYSIIGAEYNEGGFMPQVVALHLTYFDEEGAVRVRHFTSDEEFGESDVAGKFSDALAKMLRWAHEGHALITDGLQEFEDIHAKGRFPGLGYAKKLSLKHHMEMMNVYLEEHR